MELLRRWLRMKHERVVVVVVAVAVAAEFAEHVGSAEPVAEAAGFRSEK